MHKRSSRIFALLFSALLAVSSLSPAFSSVSASEVVSPMAEASASPSASPDAEPEAPSEDNEVESPSSPSPTDVPSPSPTPTPKPTATPTAKPTPTPTPQTVTVVTGTVTASAGLNLRKGAGTNYGVILTIPYNKTVTVLDRSNSAWYKVKYNNNTGYVSSEYLKVTTKTVTVTPTPKPSSGASSTASPTEVPSEDITIVPHSDEIKIIKQYATKNDCYITNERIVVQGLMLHSVGTSQPDAAALAEAYNEYNPGGREVCPHAFVQSDGVVYQILPWNMYGWHSGGPSNGTHIGIEMCEPDTIVYSNSSGSFYTTDQSASIAYVKGTYNAAVNLFAELCIAYELDPLGYGIIISHSEAHSLGTGSNHGDPEHLWNGLGLPYSMDTFRSDVAARVEALK